MSPSNTGRKARTRYFVDLFAGCGGASLGLEQAGFTPAYVNELNEHALTTYLANRQGPGFEHLTDLQSRDIRSELGDTDQVSALATKLHDDLGIDTAAGELDLVVGGPPCQGYSGIGHRRSYAVDRTEVPSNHLYNHMVHVIQELRPRIFLFENVRGLFSAQWTDDGRRIWWDVWKAFFDMKTAGGDKPSYTVASALVRAGDYGVPQNRPRILMVGIRNDLIPPTDEIRWHNAFSRPTEQEEKAKSGADQAIVLGFLPPPLPTAAPGLAELLSDLADPNYKPGQAKTETYPTAPNTDLQTELRTSRDGTSVSGPGAPVTEHEYSKHRPDIVEKFQYMLEHDGDIPPEMQTKKFAQRVLQEEWGADAAPDITATSLPDDYVHYSQPRSLTVREMARIQTFPDWYEFTGPRTTGGLRRAGNPQEGIHEREVPKYTQIGNAIPVRLARAIGEHFIDKWLS